DLFVEKVGVVNIRSVYDFDGTASVDIMALADPAETTAAERPARFLRLLKPVSIPDDDIVDLDGTAFGPNNRLGMREILGYAPIEPDGSVRVKVPANVAFALEVLDANGRRISPRHDNWLQVMPGEELRCNGCHSPQSTLSHGRRGSFDSAYPGATATGVPFPNTVGTLSPDAGETMAEVRTRMDPTALEPSVDLLYTDVWTDSGVRAPDDPLDFRYVRSGGGVPVVPTASGCVTEWSGACRIVIHYERHIHPLWSL